MKCGILQPFYQTFYKTVHEQHKRETPSTPITMKIFWENFFLNPFQVIFGTKPMYFVTGTFILSNQASYITTNPIQSIELYKKKSESFPLQLHPRTISNLESLPGKCNSEATVKIAIVGGGIAGITTAMAINTRLREHQPSKHFKIHVFESDNLSLHQNDNNVKENSAPCWKAATARNANTIVPGASMNVVSQRSSLTRIITDTVKQWTEMKLELCQRVIFQNKPRMSIIDNFDKVPPYFAFHLWDCLGPRATKYERDVFFTFFKNLISISIKTGQKESKERAQYLVQLTQANRFCLLHWSGKEGNREVDFRQGFLSIYRSKTQAERIANEVNYFGEEAELINDTAAIIIEPRIKNIPLPRPFYVVKRPKDLVANCALYCHHLKSICCKDGVIYKNGSNGSVQRVEAVKKNLSNKPGYMIHLDDGSSIQADIVVLAAGINTPLLAHQLGIGHACPTYPLRGYSLTLNNQGETFCNNNSSEKESNSNYNLYTAFSIDQIYCSFIPGVTRLTGFGEIAGFPKDDTPTSFGPRVLSRYAKAIFPGRDISEEAVECYRPISADDLPIVGEVKEHKVLFLHTGHGTLGWSLCCATSECVAQGVEACLSGENREDFYLSNGTTIPKHILSPDRFTS